MEYDEIKGLLIIVTLWGAATFTLAGCMERRLRKLDRVVKQIEDDNKYVN